MSELNNHLQSKIISGIELNRVLAREKLKGSKIVFTNGCFDILHRGHIEYLMAAANLGDILIVGLNSDNSVKRIKGPSRPVQDQESRSKVMASLYFVSYVAIFDEDTPFNLINQIKPIILVKGGDYKNLSEIVGYDIVTSNGGKVLTIPFVEGYSTTSILNKIG